MRRVLIVSPNFAPLNTPDMQRVRLSLPYFRENGWEPVVLAVEPDSSGTGVLDPLLETTYPSDVRIERVRGLPPRLGRRFGIGGIWWRCGGALRRKAEALLAREPFNLVFFSTTVFPSFAQGPRWSHRFGVPYVLDYQDPWVNTFYRRTNTQPPGGRLKFAFAQWHARRHEPRTVRSAAGIVAVSDAYLAELQAKYAVSPERCRCMPFGASQRDMDVARTHRPAAPLVDFEDGNHHLVYTGRCGPDMAFALAALFRAFARFLQTDPAVARRVRFHFIGSDYAPPPLGREWARPVARQEGVADFVHEHCQRVPYFDALHYLLRAQGLVVVGSTDSTYSASKLFPYILARKPTLLVFHEKSPVMSFARELGAGTRISFGDRPRLDSLVEALHHEWFRCGGMHTTPRLNEAAFAPYTASHLTRKLAGFFDACAPDAKGAP